MALIPRTSLFEIAAQDIEAEYMRLGHTLGWRFLNVGRKVLDGPVRVALITINPGGDHIPPDHPAASCENGASYLVERWGDSSPGQSVLQRQVQHLFGALAAEMRYEGSPSQLLESSLVSQFVPFRSARFETLPRQAESLQFARKLWSRILPIAKPRLIVCLGREIQQQLAELLPQCLGATPSETTTLSTGWGNYNAEITTFQHADGHSRLLYLPHLSRWTLFTSPKCRPYMPAIIHAAARDA